MADKDEPWKGDNISIVFITPDSAQDIRIRPRVRQNHYGGISPFDVTTYQYDNTIMDERDLSQIFRSIIKFLNGMGYKDPFEGTPKAAKVIPLSANIKPYKEPTRKARNISVDKDGNYVSANAWGADYVTENNKIKQYTNMNMKLIRLTEADLHRIVKESVNRILRETAYDINSLEYKQMYDSGGWDNNDEDDETSKEIRGYEALPDKARHPYGADIPDFEDRVKKRDGFGRWRPNDGDKLASKDPNNIYKRQQEKREGEQYVSDRYKMAMRDLPFSLEYLHDKFGIDDPHTLPKDVIVNAYDSWKERQRESERYI